MAKTIKKILAVILVAVICVCACSCTISSKTTISASGNVIQNVKMSIEKAKIDNIKARLKDKSDTVFENEAEDESYLEEIEDMLEEFKQETVDDVTYYYDEMSGEGNISEYNTALDRSEMNIVASASTKDMWIYNPDMSSSNYFSQIEGIEEVQEAFDKLGIEIKTYSEIKFPYAITDTNCEKIDDYTIIEPTDKQIYYVVTEKSEADWTKAENKEEAIKEMALKKLQPTKPTYVKVSYASKTKFAVAIDVIEWSEIDDFSSIGNARGNKFELQVQVNGGEWKTHKVYSAEDIGFGEVYFKFTEGKTYRFRARSIRESASGAFEPMYSSYKLSAQKQAAYLSNCPYVKATSPKKGQLKVAFKKAQKVKVWGYRIRYSTDKNFKKGVKAVNVSASKMPKTIKGLKSGKTYYVQVRKYVKGSYGEKIFGTNCKAKKVKVK